jgi:hypothetical protein
MEENKILSGLLPVVVGSLIACATTYLTGISNQSAEKQKSAIAQKLIFEKELFKDVSQT